MIRECSNIDLEEIRVVINDAAIAYKNTIPSHLYREPWMTERHLRDESEGGVRFFGFEEEATLLGVMGVQDIKDVTLIRHSYVRTDRRRKGVGSALIQFHKSQISRPVLVGCLKAMTWAISFYQKHGFILVSDEERDYLRASYWNLSPEHVRNSVVLVDSGYLRSRNGV